MNTNLVKISFKPFKDLTIIELYAILRLRSEVFVVEQNCVYQDIDGKDQYAVHIIGKKGEDIIACTRIFRSGSYFQYASIGRIVVQKKSRNYGYGHDMVKASIETIKTLFNEDIIEISAQEYLIGFYQQHGFKISGALYMEDGIPHIQMIRRP